MNWQTDTVTSTFDATTAAKMINERINQRAMYGDPALNAVGLQRLAANSVVGMNVNEVENMRVAIEDYCAEIENYIKGLDPTADANIAFKSEEINQALRTYMESVQMYCVNLVSQLRAFSDKLADVRNQWQIAAQNMSQTIGSTSGSAFASGSTYNRTIQ